MFSVAVHGVDGSVWPLTESRHLGVFLGRAPVGLRSSGDWEPVAGSLELVVADNDSDGRKLDDINVTMRKWRRAWSMHNYGTLRINDPGSWETWIRLRLSEPIPDLPDVDSEGYEEFVQAVVADPKFPWWVRTRTYRETSFEVANAGDYETWPRVRWKQGGTVRMPSGATISLPTVPQWRTIHLDPYESCAVVDDSGKLDRPLWRQLRNRVFPEALPVGAARRFSIPSGAQLLVDERIDDPWR